MGKTFKCGAHKKDLVLICLDQACYEKRICCVECVDIEHSCHGLISFKKFEEKLASLQNNRTNPQRGGIINAIRNFKQMVQQEIATLRKQLLFSLMQCDDLIVQYFDKLESSFLVEKHDALLEHLYTNLTSQKVDEYYKLINQFSNMTLSNLSNTKHLIHEASQFCTATVRKVKYQCKNFLKPVIESLKRINLAYSPNSFKYQFSNKNCSSALKISDSKMSIERSFGGLGGYPICLLATPFNPIDCQVTFRIESQGSKNQGVWFGVCLADVVSKLNYQNCAGIGKGTYAIDQMTQNFYDEQSTNLAISWNHHDATYDQASIGTATSLVGWSFEEGDEVEISVDYYSSMINFVKGENYFQMPASLLDGPLYGFAGVARKGDIVSVRKT